ncbi:MULTISPECIES: siderophore ABC transporter substrate-binding protein [unclassified Paenibacillus]|uniref:siderophore ABC transporter substrate-binding protein n=1 Tax=unclassified Paenibacillus TaxID=185978 RepID=UPI001AE9A44E|nr:MULTISPECIES: siderophore ABC transporter substrate-binding protein [unclassified Paenibacillus]MBP1156252.1 iron complex transport system substrate-binding protein [Paenibacillus sp. PvP091]MBP1168362.1 iron complex transport system substrate-binding protein [Paenibacillus sp. PvR098]MBP2439390.1 iron complex transport system substrate-binding protein [Paenibacillus sp. PvP052]
MSKKLSVIFFSIMMVLFVAACGTTGSNEGSSAAQAPATNEDLIIKHQLGETKVKKSPEKVVVFDFGTLDSLDKLGVNVTGVPQANIPPYLSKYKDAKYMNVGSLTEPDFEKINAIGPDLIIISGRQSAAYEELTKIGPTIFMGIDNAKYMESFKKNVTTLGTIFDKASAAQEELAKVEDAIKKVNEKAAASGNNALIILANGGKVSAYGPGSRFGILHDVLGFTPVDQNIEVSTHGQSISMEFIVEKDPDYLFVVDRDAAVGSGSSAKQVVENELVKKTKAFKNGHIVYLDPNYWYLSGGGLISVAEMVKEVEAGLK